MSLPLAVSVVPAPQPGVTRINVTANFVTWDPNSQKLYLSTPSTAANGNSVEPLDPVTGNFGTASFAGSEPFLLSVSDTGKYIYVSLNGTSEVQRMTLPALQPDITISLGSDSFYGPFFALDLQASPVADGTAAVVRGVPNVSPQEEGGVLIYDDATARPDRLCGFIEGGCTGNGDGLYDTIQWNGDGTALYIGNNEDTGFDFYTAPVNADGIQTPKDYGGVLEDFGELIHYDPTTKLVYGDDGRAINPSDGSIAGTFAASGSAAPDGANGLIYFLGQTIDDDATTYTIESFDINTFVPVASRSITGVVGYPERLIRWGSNGLAFLTYSPEPLAGADNGFDLFLINDSTFLGAQSVRAVRAPIYHVQKTWPTRKNPGSLNQGAQE